MKHLVSLALCFEHAQLRVLNQTKLPHEQEWLVCQSPDDMVTIIRTLAVRGAPLIGVAAALALAHFVEKGAQHDDIELAAKKLIAARPTAVNLSYCILTQLNAYHQSGDPQAIIQQAEKLFEEDAALSAAMSLHGACLIQPGESILTHCNTGGLVTTGMGTALGAMRCAHEQGKKIHVYVDETRPLLQGARLTTWELSRMGIPHTLICDNMAATLMRQGKIQRVMVGADRIAANGDSANKIGTYGVAALAYLHQIPFHIVAPDTTIDWTCQSGDDIIIEAREAAEVRGFGALQWAPAEVAVYNPAFDVTPHAYITSWVTNQGIVHDLKTLQRSVSFSS